MNISSHWVIHLLARFPDAQEHFLTALARLAPDTIRTGDRVVCIDATDTFDQLVNGNTYTVGMRTTTHYQLLEGGLWDQSRFRPAVEAVDPVTDLLRAVDRGSWPEVLEARAKVS